MQMMRRRRSAYGAVRADVDKGSLVGELLDAHDVRPVEVDEVEPGSIQELRRSHTDLDRGIGGRRGRGDCIDDSVEARAGGDDEARVGGVEDEVTASEEDLAGRRHDCGRGGGRHGSEEDEGGGDLGQAHAIGH